MLRTYNNPDERFDRQLEQQRQTQYDLSKAALASIVECIIYLNRQCLPFPGHRNDHTQIKLQTGEIFKH